MLIVGLGNPGPKYKNTPHSIGFLAIDFFQKENGFSDFYSSGKFDALISDGVLGDEKVILAKPQTFMNNSGIAIKKLLANYQPRRERGHHVALRHGASATNLIIVHDDIDLPLGKIKIAKNRGAAGHKGVESIIKDLGTKNFIRIRVGIQPKTGKPKNATNFVLQEFNKQEEKTKEKTIKKTAKAVEIITKEGLERAMNLFNAS